jgi:Zn-dependent alcohol dehydrogenase
LGNYVDRTLPATLGREAAGIIAAVGPGVDMTSNVKSWLPMFLHFLCPLVLRHRKRRSQ